MSYCIAFSAEGATDVTRRYVRDAASQSLPRKSCAEEVLLFILAEIKRQRRDGMRKEDQHRLIKEDHREERELRSYVVHALTAQIERMITRDRSGGGKGGDGGNGGNGGGNAQIKRKPLPPRHSGTDA